MLIDPRDNNLVLSLRNTSSVIKIDRKTGNILWTLGGLADDFSLTAQQRFASQHTVSLLPSGEWMIFDNHAGQESSWDQEKLPLSLPLNTRSRILFFKLDENNHTVTHFRQIVLPYFASSMGSAYLTEDNTFIVGYGSARKMAAEEIDQRRKTKWRMKILNPLYVSYRVYKYNSLY